MGQQDNTADLTTYGIIGASVTTGLALAIVYARYKGKIGDPLPAEEASAIAKFLADHPEAEAQLNKLSKQYGIDFLRANFEHMPPAPVDGKRDGWEGVRYWARSHNHISDNFVVLANGLSEKNIDIETIYQSQKNKRLSEDTIRSLAFWLKTNDVVVVTPSGVEVVGYPKQKTIDAIVRHANGNSPFATLFADNLTEMMSGDIGVFLRLDEGECAERNFRGFSRVDQIQIKNNELDINVLAHELNHRSNSFLLRPGEKSRAASFVDEASSFSLNALYEVERNPLYKEIYSHFYEKNKGIIDPNERTLKSAKEFRSFYMQMFLENEDGRNALLKSVLGNGFYDKKMQGYIFNFNHEMQQTRITYMKHYDRDKNPSKELSKDFIDTVKKRYGIDLTNSKIVEELATLRYPVGGTLFQKIQNSTKISNGKYIITASGKDWQEIAEELNRRQIKFFQSESGVEIDPKNNLKFEQMISQLWTAEQYSNKPVGVNDRKSINLPDPVGDGKPVSPHPVDDEAPTRRYSMSGKQEPYSGFGDAFNAGLNDVDDAFPDFEDAFKKGMTASTDADEISDRIMRVLTAGILSGEITREGAKAFFKENGLVLQDVEYDAIYDAIKEYKTIDKAIKEDMIVRTKFQELASHFRQKFSADSLSPLPKKTMDSLYKLGREKCNLSPEEVDAFVKKTASIHFYTENGKPVLTVGRQRLGYTRAEFARKILEDAAGDPGYINDIKNFIKTEGTRFYLLPVSDVNYDAGGHFSPASGEVVLRNNKWVSGTVRHEFIHATLDKNEKLSKLYEESHIAATYVNEAVAKTSNLYHDDNAILNGIKEYHITAVKKEFPDLSEYEQLLKAEKRARADYATLLLSTQSERRAFLENYRKKGIITLDNDSFRWEFGMLNSEIDGWQMCYTKQAATHHLDTFDKMGAQSVLDEIFDGRAKISDQFVIENAVNTRFNKWTTVISSDGKRKYFYSGKREDLLPEIEQAYADRCHFDDEGRFYLEVTDENEYHELKNKKIVRDSSGSTPKDGRINWLTKIFDEDFELHFDRMHSYTDGAIDIDVSHLSPDEIEATIDRYEKQGITVKRRGDNFLEIRDAQSLAKLNEIVEELSPESITVDKNRVFYRKFPKNAGNLKMYIDVHKIPYFEDGESIYISNDYICDKHKPLQAARSDVVTGYKLDPNDKTMAQQALLLQRAGLGKIKDGVYFSSQNAHRFTDLKKDLPKLIKAKTDVFARAAFVPVRFPNKRPGAKTPYIETYKMLTDHLPEAEVKKITSEMGRYGIEFKTGPDGSLVMTERSAVVYDMVRTAQASKKLTPEDLLKAKSRMMKIDIDSNSGKRKFFKKTMKALNKTGKVLDVATAYGLAFDEDFWNKLGDGDLVGYAAEIGEAILEIPSMVHTLYYNRDEVFTRENMSEFATSVGEQVLDAPGAVGVGINRSVSKIFTGSDWWIEGGIDVYGKDGKREWSDGYNMVATGDFDVSVDEANVQTEPASFINYGVKNGQIKNGYMESVTWGFLPSSKSVPIASESEHPIGGLATSGLVGAYIESQYLRPARYQENTLDGVLRMAIRKPGTQMTDAVARGIISGKNVDVSDAFEIAAEYRIEEGRVTSQRQQYPDGSISVHYYDNKDVTFNHNGSTQNELTALWGDVNNKDLKNIKIGNRTHTVRVSPDTRNLKFYKRDEETGDYIFCEEFSRYKDEEYPVGTTDVNGARNEARYKRLETKYTKYYRIKAEDMVYTPEYARAKGNARGNNPRKMSVDDFIKPDITGHVEFDLALADGRMQVLRDENGKPRAKQQVFGVMLIYHMLIQKLVRNLLLHKLLVIPILNVIEDVI